MSISGFADRVNVGGGMSWYSVTSFVVVCPTTVQLMVSSFIPCCMSASSWVVSTCVRCLVPSLFGVSGCPSTVQVLGYSDCISRITGFMVLCPLGGCRSVICCGCAYLQAALVVS